MNPGGLVLIVFSIIGISQLFAGDALKRLKILPDTAGQSPTTSSSAGGLTSRPAPDPGTAPTPTGPLTSRPAPNSGSAPAPSGPLTSRPAPAGG